MARWLLLFSLLLLLPTFSAGKPQTLTPMHEPAPAPVLMLTDVDGKTWRLSDLRGQPVIVNFWATWCPPCRAEMPSLQRAWRQLQAEGIMVLAVNVGDSSAAVIDFSLNHGLDFPILLDADSTAMAAWPAQGLPATFIIDAKGRIAFRAIGERTWDDPQLLAEILQLRP